MDLYWKPIPGYNGSYWVNMYGQVFRVYPDGHTHCLAQHVDSRGYPKVTLSKEGHMKTHRVHRLVATCFIPNPNQYDEINHIDEDKTNNSISNLEWCNRSMNLRHGSWGRKHSEAVSIPVLKLSLDGVTVLCEYSSVSDAAKANHSHTQCISACCKGKRKSAAGFKWKYKKG